MTTSPPSPFSTPTYTNCRSRNRRKNGCSRSRRTTEFLLDGGIKLIPVGKKSSIMRGVLLKIL
jgi:hypothetical protein